MSNRAFLLVGICWAAILSSATGLQGQRLQMMAGRIRHAQKARDNPDAADAPPISDQHPVCVYGAEEGFAGHVQVFVSRDNSRDLQFDNDGLGSQTEVKCKGPIPSECSTTTAAARSSNQVWDLNSTQTCDLLDCPCDRDASTLDFSYMVDMMQEVTPACESWSVIHPGEESGPMRVLLVGLGGGALPAYMLSRCPKGSVFVESVEYDPRVVKAAERFFGFQVIPGANQVETDDGGKAVARRASNPDSSSREQYDVVLVDCFADGGTVPDSCKNDAFIGNVKKILKNGGKLIQQIWSPQYEDVIQRYRTAFGAEQVEGTDIELGVNHLIIARKPADDNLGQY